MNDLYFAPASKNNPVDVPRGLRSSKTGLYEDPLTEWSPYTNFVATVRTPVCESTAGVGLPLQYDAVPVWGITPNTAEGYWPPTQGDHIIFFTGSERYPFIARVDQTTREEKLAADLWPHYSLSTKRGSDITNPVPWSHIIYFDLVWQAEIPDRAIRALRNTTNLTLYRFSRVPKNRLKRLSPPLEQWKISIDSVVLYSRRENRQKLTRAVNQSSDEDTLLSIALKPLEIEPAQLSPRARRNIISCLRKIYSTG